ncbi:Phage major capsid protein E [Cohaesibacter sp. ES.047]|uniref:major capsid protein n=1 Tax=Cohaesibacter sp. ES.047 TaxID=1798205 RepID=UPI000BB68CC1|nr:major capsid protein [Cohaesibacter sp. ES.047]SNY93417.1 Phage major capsid protein E [Cohaesibacter sp. ES.047]
MDLFTLHELISVIDTIIVPKTHFLDKYFKVEHRSDKPKIYFDDVFKGQVTLAPFVIPTSAGRPQSREGFEVKSFAPAYLKPIDNIRPSDAQTRLAGEPFGGVMSAMDRMEQAALQVLARQKLQITGRWEWLAQMALINSQVTIVGDDYPSKLVDFGRNANNTIVVTEPTEKWSDVDHDIKSDLENWSSAGAAQCGSPLTDVYMTNDIWRVFKKNNSIKEELDTTIRNVSTIVTSPTADDPTNPVTFKGMVGEFYIYVHNGTYRDPLDNQTKRYLAADEVLMVAPVGATGTEGVYGVRGFGMIEDKKAGLQALPIFPRVYEQDNPSMDVAMTQSAPLMIPGRPNGTMKIKGLI